MKGLKYQLKSIRRDKMCLLTFLLPVIVGIAINLLSGVSFQTMGETTFGVVGSNITDDTVECETPDYSIRRPALLSEATGTCC